MIPGDSGTSRGRHETKNPNKKLTGIDFIMLCMLVALEQKSMTLSNCTMKGSWTIRKTDHPEVQEALNPLQISQLFALLLFSPMLMSVNWNDCFLPKVSTGTEFQMKYRLHVPDKN